MPNDRLRPWLENCPAPRARPAGIDWDVFLSYRSVERPWVIALYDTLVLAGYRVFIDQLVLGAGARLEAELAKNLEKSSAGVIVWSSRSTDSEWLEREHAAMRDLVNERKDSANPYNLVLANIDGSSVPLGMRHTLWIDFKDYPDGPMGGELVKLLFGLVGRPFSEQALRDVLEVDQATRRARIQLVAAREIADAAGIVTMAEAQATAWLATPHLYGLAAEILIALGNIDDALRVLDVSAHCFPGTVRLRQMRGLALRRKGDILGAQRVLAELHAEGHRDPETMGMYAATWKKRHDGDGDRRWLAKSRDLYLEAFRGAPDNAYVGVNAASLSTVLGDVVLGAELAGQVEPLVRGASDTEYWDKATEAEVYLLQRRLDDAERAYRAAARACPTLVGNFQTSIEQVERLAGPLALTDAEVARLKKAFEA